MKIGDLVELRPTYSKVVSLYADFTSTGIFLSKCAAIQLGSNDQMICTFYFKSKSSTLKKGIDFRYIWVVDEQYIRGRSSDS